MTASEKEINSTLAARALEGDRAALEKLIRNLQPYIYKLAQRFLYCPEESEDATQEILMKVITHLSSFQNRSRFTTWAYTIAINYLRDIKRKSKIPPMSFEEFSDDLAEGLTDEAWKGPEEELILDEIRIGCTTAMLQCLDDDARLAYTLGEILELDHKEAAQVLNCPPATYRKRLSRARDKVTDFMMQHCGLAEPTNACRCNKRVERALELNRVTPEKPLFSDQSDTKNTFPDILNEIRKLKEQQRAAALFRAQQDPNHSDKLVDWLRNTLKQSTN